MRALYGALSRGTEALVLAGRVPASEFERMRAPFMAGNFPFPVKYGYAIVGRVEAGPAELVGRDVFALHPHQTLFNVPASAVAVLPDDVPPRARCSPPTWRPRSMPCGTPRPDRPTASPSSAPAWSARWSPFYAGGLPARK